MITLAKTSDLNASDSSGKPFILTSLNIQLYYGGVHLSNSPDGVYWRPNSCKAYAKFTDFPTVRSVIWSNIMYLWIVDIKKNQRGNISSLLPEYVLACENSLVLSSMVLKGFWSKKKKSPWGHHKGDLALGLDTKQKLCVTNLGCGVWKTFFQAGGTNKTITGCIMGNVESSIYGAKSGHPLVLWLWWFLF